ncbi:MAG: UDP-2,3-diacylglucosamine diphosphatase LpxI [Pirellulales bacterium]|nr:UDP-2,3-diacylglucosamine diphosphatase LpxI [Pirellulales bacterium]
MKTAASIVRMHHAHQHNRPRIGLLAGWGEYPVCIAEKLNRLGYDVFALGLRGHADTRLGMLCREFRWIGAARLGAAIRFFRRYDVHQATMAGKIQKAIFFQPLAFVKHVPDWRAIKTFAPHFLKNNKDRRDDSLLATLVNAFAEHGIEFRPPTNYVPELLVDYGLLTLRKPTAKQLKDVEFGWKLAKEMGRLDVGQTVAVKGQAALAVEAIEGTDECIRRAGKLCRAGGFTIVKVAKPQQDMRFDVPTIGRGTLETMATAGATVLAVQADKTIIVGEDQVIDFANRNKMVIVALEADGATNSLNQQDVAA